MKIKNILITGPTALALTGCNDIKIKKNQTFNAFEYNNKLIFGIPYDSNGDNIPDGICSFYDLNKNTEPDCTALYVFERNILGQRVLNPNSIAVYVDKDEDRKLDYGYEDRNRDGKLETKITKKDFEKVYEQINEGNEKNMNKEIDKDIFNI